MVDKKAAPCVCARERRITSRLPPKYHRAQLGDLPSAIQEAAVRWMGCPSEGLLIMGSVGTGKTYLAAAILRALVSAKKDAIFQRFAIFYADLREAYRTNASEELVVGPLAQARFLVLDDLGAGGLSDHERRSTLELIERRLNENLPTIVTTNWNLKKISEAMDDRIASRLSAFTKIELLGQDLRLAGVRRGNS